MNHNSLFFLFLLVVSFNSDIIYSQQIIKANGSAQLELTDDMSRSETKSKVRELAIINALERTFGQVIIQGNATYISNMQSGNEVETNTVFNTIANTSVKGEVLEIIEEKFTDVEGLKIVNGTKEKVLEIRCDIEIKAIEIITPKVNFTCFPLSCENVGCRKTEFKNGDNLFLYFSSPLSGYISIYLDETNVTHCLYPFSTMPYEFEGGVSIEADKQYILFSNKPELNYFPEKNFIPDTYELYTSRLQEMNRMFIIFSKTSLNKPALLPVKEIENDYWLPKSLPSEEFQKWLNSYRSSNKDQVQVEIIDITIRK